MGGRITTGDIHTRKSSDWLRLASASAVVVLESLLRMLKGPPDAACQFANETERVERLAMRAVMAAAKQLGYEPRDVSKDNCATTSSPGFREKASLDSSRSKGQSGAPTRLPSPKTKS